MNDNDEICDLCGLEFSDCECCDECPECGVYYEDCICDYDDDDEETK